MTTAPPAGAIARVTRFAVVGEYQPHHETHPATTEALGHAAATLGFDIEVSWLATDSIDGGADALGAYDGIWIAPGSPYRSLEGALQAIGIARDRGIPLLGTCAGFQHIVLEYARNVMGLRHAAHAEYDPDADILFVTALSCSLAGKEFTVRLARGTRAAQAYGATRASERYYCNFGLNPAFADTLSAAGLTISGVDGDGEARVVELPDHPFFVGTLFVPQVSSAPGRPHPLVRGFVAAAGRRCAGPDRQDRSRAREADPAAGRG